MKKNHAPILKYSLMSLVTAVGIGSSAYAADGVTDATGDSWAKSEDSTNMRPNIGLFIGQVSPTQNIDNTVNYGAEIGLNPAMPISFGIQGSYYKVEDNFVGGTTSFQRIPVLGKLAFNLGGNIPIISNMFVGGKAGVVIDKQELNTVLGNSESTNTDFAWAPMAGIDIPFQKSFTVGAEVSYLFAENNNQVDNWDAHGALKYWF